MRIFRNAEPEIYEKFLKAFRDLTDEFTVAVTETPPSDILVAQGRAQMMRKLEQKFNELPE
jgi:hypothetical protein